MTSSPTTNSGNLIEGFCLDRTNFDFESFLMASRSSSFCLKANCGLGSLEVCEFLNINLRGATPVVLCGVSR